MLLKKGDFVYCHTDGFMSDEPKLQFCKKGKRYKIVRVFRNHNILSNGTVKPVVHFNILDEKGSYHSFIYNHLMIGENEWFKAGRVLLTEKEINLENHYKQQPF